MSRIVVAAAIVERAGCFLVTRRLEGTHLAGAWEFPGGKCEPGETHDACLEREMREELGVSVTIRGLFSLTTYAYEDRLVELFFYRCDLQGEPQPQLGQVMRWVRREELRELEFPPADETLVELLAGEEPSSH